MLLGNKAAQTGPMMINPTASKNDPTERAEDRNKIQTERHHAPKNWSRHSAQPQSPAVAHPTTPFARVRFRMHFGRTWSHSPYFDLATATSRDVDETYDAVPSSVAPLMCSAVIWIGSGLSRVCRAAPDALVTVVDVGLSF